jgi:xanthine dehydrogenase accessory factor
LLDSEEKTMTAHVDVMDIVSRMKAAEECFALATVVRTVSVTAAKAGAKGIIKPDGTIIAGWIGGGCARGAVLKAAREAMLDGQPRLVSIQPEDLMADLGVRSGEQRDGVTFFRNACPSKGTMDIFVEPVLPRPALVILGSSPVAIALSALGRQFGYHVTIAAPAGEFSLAPEADCINTGFDIDASEHGKRYVVISTQGKGDEAALRAALSSEAEFYGFVGSRRKIQVLKEKLLASGAELALLERIKAPAGLDIGAITPDEIALSILAEIIAVRRLKQRTALNQH